MATLSFCSPEQYENNERGFTIEAEISQKNFFGILSVLGSVYEDPPQYHCQLRNEQGELLYVIVDSD